MRSTKFRALSTYALLLVGLAASMPACAFPPKDAYLTWRSNPATAITVNFQSPEPDTPSRVEYDLVPHQDREGPYAFTATGESRQIPGLRDGRYIHSVELTGLQPGTAYYFKTPFSEKEQKFRTLPNDGSPIRFVVGGDMGVLPRVQNLLEKAAEEAPLFGVVGGDIAYANGNLSKVHLWDIWMRYWSRTMVTPDGFTIPMVLAIGNHEVNDKGGTPEERAPFYFGLLGQGESTYFAREAGRDTLLLFLDTGHIAPVDGAQASWLEEQLRNSTHRNKLAIYHVPLYPSHRPFEDTRSVLQRQIWQPLFERYGVDVGFEHHDHTFKRSKPILGAGVDPEGIVYVGDGCLGMVPREITTPLPWYLEKASPTEHFWLVDVNAADILLRAIDLKGNVIDEVRLPATSARAAKPAPAAQTQ